jgi:LAO/AO transport system kinase
MDNSINKDLKIARNTQLEDIDYLVCGIQNGNIMILSKALTLIESTNIEKRKLANQLISQLKAKKSNTIRLGITGTPGVGKSTFIESFGLLLIENGYKVAVLAIDPSSSISHGSILGDKTRMQDLSTHPQAFIRPTSSGNHLGGTSEHTRESILLCEAAGFDFIIIETVGVGQSETLVSKLVDHFILLLQPGAGDELQGIKRGIVEMADIIVVNKADGDKLQLAKEARNFYSNAIHLFPAKGNGVEVKVMTCSALEKTGINEVFHVVQNNHKYLIDNNLLNTYRSNQLLAGFDENLTLGLKTILDENPKLKNILIQLKEQIANQSISPYEAANTFLEKINSMFND